MARVIKSSELDGQAGANVAAMGLKPLTEQAGGPVPDADRQAERILSLARQEARVIHLQAEEAGYADGFERGREQGCAAGERRAHQEMRAKLERRLDELAELAAVAVGQLALAGTPVRQGQEGSITIQLNSDQLAGLGKEGAKFFDALSRQVNVTVVGDRDVAHGDVRLVVGGRGIDTAGGEQFEAGPEARTNV